MEIDPVPVEDSDQFEFMKSCQVFGAVIEETSRGGTKDAGIKGPLMRILDQSRCLE